MVKQLFYIFIILGLLCASCTREVLDDGKTNDGMKTLSFTTQIPDMQSVVSRSIDPDGLGLKKLWLFCFNPEGYYIGRVLADVGETGGTIQVNVPLNTGIVHFIANQNLDQFDEVNKFGEHESSIIPGLEATSGRIVYWTRVVLEKDGDISGLEVKLVRNQAKISFQVEDGVDFIVDGFCVCDAYATGTTAPFDKNASLETCFDSWFTDPFVTLPPGAELAKNPSDVLASDEKEQFVFEHDNHEDNPIYIIVKGHTAATEGDPRYYKLLMIENESKEPFSIIRNRHYIVHIETALVDGALNFEEAQQATPTNNIWIGVDESYPYIMDNEVTLDVQQTLWVFPNEEGDSEITYTYRKNNTEIGVEKGPSVEWLSADPSFVGDKRGNTYSSSDGVGKITFSLQGDVDVSRATVLVKAGKLSRKIKILATKNFEFTPVWTSSAVYGGEAQQKVTLLFTIPDDFPEELLPLRCLVSANGVDANYNTNPLDLISNDSEGYGDFDLYGYKYVYNAEETGVQRLYFTSNLKYSGEDEQMMGTIALEAKNFNRVEKLYTFVNKRRNVVFDRIESTQGVTPLFTYGTEPGVINYCLVPKVAGTEFDFTFHFEEDGETVTIDHAHQVLIYTSNLEPVGDEGLFENAGESTTSGGHYYLYTVQANQTSYTTKWKTKTADCAEVFRISADFRGEDHDHDPFRSESMELANFSNFTFNLRSNQPSISYKPGSLFEVSFDVKSFLSELQPDGKAYTISPGTDFYCDINIGDFVLDGVQANVEDLGNGRLRYHVVEKDATHTIRLKTQSIVSAGTISITSDETRGFTPENIVLENAPLKGKLTFNGGTDVPEGGFVTVERSDGTRIGMVTMGDQGEYEIHLRGEYRFEWSDRVIVYYMQNVGLGSDNKVIYQAETDLETLLNGGGIDLKQP